MLEQTGDVSTAAILINPAASRASKFRQSRALKILGSYGVEASVRIAEEPGDLQTLSKSAANGGVDLVFVVGGDGAVREVADGLVGSESALAVLPAGTANVWAKEIGVPNRFGEAIRAHVQGQRLRVDLGRAGNEPFLLMASLGWDAEIVRRVGGTWKKRLGELAYVARGITLLPKFHPVQLDWATDGEERRNRIALMVVSNTSLYGGRVRFSPKAVINDGLLDVCTLAPSQRGDGVRLTTLLARGRLSGARGVIELQSRDIDIATHGVPYQLDGDAGGFSPVRFHVEPEALMVSLPPGPLPRLFR
ncbi:MAG TPA: diacylglycerol kinase family protein [Dehalococcoidia bacterium]|jgi:YegS/Rv2252/BmrU family lipid kinase|nr:diacylglycerol kinase family protein [Dehalococcoidia bacterium]